jgi:two-component system, NarL family, nitrate/nitrite response regulator NarL
MSDRPYSEDVRIDEVLQAIVKRFVELIGASVALSAARKVPGLKLSDDGSVLDYDRTNPIANVTRLVEQFRTAFGDTAITLAHQATLPVAKEHAIALLQEAGFDPPPGSFVIRLLLVDDHVLFREGLISLIAPQPDLNVVGQAGNVHEAVALARQLRPDIVLMDHALPDGDGVEATQAILAEWSDARVVFLTVHEDDDILFAAIRAGAVGYLIKNTRAAELLAQLRAVARGEAGVSPAIARRILEEFSHTPAARHADPVQSTQLTAREVEIVRAIAQGASNRDIARQLFISENTVKNHVRNVLSKLHLRNRQNVADYARSHGLTPPESPDLRR